MYRLQLCAWKSMVRNAPRPDIMSDMRGLLEAFTHGPMHRWAPQHPWVNSIKIGMKTVLLGMAPLCRPGPSLMASEQHASASHALTRPMRAEQLRNKMSDQSQGQNTGNMRIHRDSCVTVKASKHSWPLSHE